MGFTGDYVAGVWMGYDDNTPLTGVTGSGLPAEIWHETMSRIVEGTEPRPLPMTAPDGTSTGLTANNQAVNDASRAAEDVLQDVLRDILAPQSN